MVSTVITPNGTRAGVAFLFSQKLTHDIITISPDGSDIVELVLLCCTSQRKVNIYLKTNGYDFLCNGSHVDCRSASRFFYKPHESYS